MNLKGKKVLQMGLGILGGGVATARFLRGEGADLTITDLKDENYLQPSLGQLKDFPQIKYVLGRHEEKDFLENEIIVINPDVPIKNKFVELAQKAGKRIENELTLFFKLCPTRDIIAITGTRGKTTTANWTTHFLKQKFANTVLAGNSPENTFLGMLPKIDKDSKVVLEVPSYQLELLGEEEPLFAPKVAVITNIYQDHLNRHGTMEEYVRTKANIFKSQTEKDFLVLNKDNEWTEFLVSLKPKSKLLYFSPDQNSPNLAASVLAAQTFGVDERLILAGEDTLPAIKFRQEKVFENDALAIYNDTAATSPEASIAAFSRFPEAVFIVGGTDRELNFENWALAVQKLNPRNLFFLSGSATGKMKAQLGWESFSEFDTLEECLRAALAHAGEGGQKTIVFSPGAKSFEKFKNEFDRGEQFNLLVQKLVK